MGLLLLPYICCIGLIKFTYEDNKLNFKHFRKYIILFSLLLFGQLICFGINYIGLNKEEWQNYHKFFNVRTNIYDFYWNYIEDYDENIDFYLSNNIDKSEQQLLKNYNLALSSQMDLDFFVKLDDYAKNKDLQQQNFRLKLSKIIYNNYYYFIGKNGIPYNYIIIFGYLGLLFLGIFNKNNKIIFRILILFFIRFIPWSYIFYTDRIENRVIVCLYIIEMLILLGIFLNNYSENARLSFWGNKIRYKYLLKILISTGCCYMIYYGHINVNKVIAEYQKREEINILYENIYEYTNKYQNNLYLADVFSTVSFSEKILKDKVVKTARNFDLLGGWNYYSPYFYNKLQEFDLNRDKQWEIILQANACFMSDSSDLKWLKDYYLNLGIPVNCKMIEQITGKDNLIMYVYRISPQ